MEDAAPTSPTDLIHKEVGEDFNTPDPETVQLLEKPLNGKPVKRASAHQNKHLNRAAAVCPPGTMTKGMVMEALNMSEENFQKLVSTKMLEAVAHGGPKNSWSFYAERDVTKVKQMMVIRLKAIPQKESTKPLKLHKYSLEAATVIFKLLKEGKDLADMVYQLHIHPLALRAILRDYAFLTESVLIPNRQMAIINALPLEGEFPIRTADVLVKLLHDLSVEKKCPKCRTADRTHLCGPCYVEAKKESDKREAAKQKAQAAKSEPEPIDNLTEDEEDETSFDLTADSVLSDPVIMKSPALETP